MLTTHVVSQGLAEELKKLGYPQDGSTFYWANFIQSFDGEYCYKTEKHHGFYVCFRGLMSLDKLDLIEGCEWIAAPLASELMDRMGANCEVFFCGRLWYAKDPISGAQFEDESICDALAKLLIHLIKQGIIGIVKQGEEKK